MTTSPLAYFWGDDELAAARGGGGAPGDARRRDRCAARALGRARRPERAPADQIARLRSGSRRPRCSAAASLAVVSNPGPLLQATEHRTSFLAALGLVAPGNALVVLDATQSGAKAPSQKRLADAVAAAGGTIRKYESPRRGALAGWIEGEARAARRDSSRRVRRRRWPSGSAASSTSTMSNGGHQTRIASLELDKLALYRGDDAGHDRGRAALVAEAIPGSVWAFADAVGERRGPAALELLDRLLDATPEPVLLAVLHRRVRELLELGDRLAGRRAAPVGRARRWASPASSGAQTLAAQAKRWTTDELTAALDGLLELDAMVKGAPGSGQDDAQRRLAFSLWVMDHVAVQLSGASRRSRQSAADQACSWTTRSLSMAKTQRPSPRSSSSIRSGSMYSCEQSSHSPPGIPKHSRSLRSGSRNVVSNRVVMSRRLQAGHRSRTLDMPRMLGARRHHPA